MQDCDYGKIYISSPGQVTWPVYSWGYHPLFDGWCSHYLVQQFWKQCLPPTFHYSVHIGVCCQLLSVTCLKKLKYCMIQCKILRQTAFMRKMVMCDCIPYSIDKLVPSQQRRAGGPNSFLHFRERSHEALCGLDSVAPRFLAVFPILPYRQ